MDGLRVTHRLRDVLIAGWHLTGGVLGRETIDRWNTIASDERFAAELRQRDWLPGWDGGTRFAVAFHSGSSLEGYCRELSIERSEP